MGQATVSILCRSVKKEDGCWADVKEGGYSLRQDGTLGKGLFSQVVGFLMSLQ